MSGLSDGKSLGPIREVKISLDAIHYLRKNQRDHEDDKCIRKFLRRLDSGTDEYIEGAHVPLDGKVHLVRECNHEFGFYLDEAKETRVIITRIGRKLSQVCD